jgi:hypothetical protein
MRPQTPREESSPTALRTRLIAYVQRIVGTHGGVMLAWHNPSLCTHLPLKPGEFLFLRIAGLPVPFRLSHADSRAFGYTYVEFEGVDTPSEARTLVECLVEVEATRLQAASDSLGQEEEEDEEDGTLETLIGTTVCDPQGTALGIIARIDTYSLNVVLTIQSPLGAELLLPLNEDLVTHWPNEEDERLLLIVPEGLLGEERAENLD